MLTHIIIAIILLRSAFVSSEIGCVKKPVEDKPKSSEVRLKEDLLCKYDKNYFPMQNQSGLLEVTMSLVVHDFNVGYSSPLKMYLESEITVNWTDIFLQWDPEDYDSINEIILNTDEIWMPSIMPSDMEFFFGDSSVLESTDCQVTPSGNVSCRAISGHHGYCMVDISLWPHDTLGCFVNFVAWSKAERNRVLVTLAEDHAILRVTDNDEWTIVNSSSRDLYNPGYHEIEYRFQVARHTPDIIQQLYIPFAVCVVLTLMTFSVSIQGIDRFILCSINIIAHIFQIQNSPWITISMGHTIPYILTIYRDSLVLATILLLETLMFKKLLSSENPAPVWLLTLDKFIASDVITKILFVDSSFTKDLPVAEQESLANEIKLMNLNRQNHVMEKYRTSKIIDRIMFVISFLFYVITTSSLLMMF